MRKKKLAIAISFTGRNLQIAKQTIAAFSKWLAHSILYSVEWIVMIPSGRTTLIAASPAVTYAGAVADVRKAAGPICVHVFDDVTMAQMRAALPDGVPDPFGDAFNYGGTTNLSRVFANGLGADFVMRVDPGVAPPVKSLDEVMDAIETHLTEGYGFTSGQYQNRIALRYKQVPQNRRTAFLHLVARCTGIDPLSQITSGALSTSRTPGLPAIPLQTHIGTDGSPKLSLVWFIDDGAMQKLTSGNPVDSLVVPRIDIDGEGSYPKNNSEYFSSVASAVYLSAIMDGYQGRTARELLDNFTVELAALVDDKCLSGDRLVPAALAQRIEEGWVSYQRLRKVWSGLCTQLGAVAVANAYDAATRLPDEVAKTRHAAIA